VTVGEALLSSARPGVEPDSSSLSVDTVAQARVRKQRR